MAFLFTNGLFCWLGLSGNLREFWNFEIFFSTLGGTALKTMNTINKQRENFGEK